MTNAHALILASKWTNAESRRRESLRAAHEQDAEVLCDLLSSYLKLKSSRKGRISALTVSAYQESVRRFLAYSGPPGSPRLALNQLTPEDFELWLLAMQAEGLSANSVKRHLYGVRNLMKALVWTHALPSDPSGGVSPPSDATPAHARKQALSRAQVRDLLALPGNHDNSLVAARDAALLTLGVSAGLRAAEIVGLDVEDVDLVSQLLRVRGKGGKLRRVPLTPGVRAILAQWLTLRRSLSAPETAFLVALSNNHHGRRLTTRGARHIAGGYYFQLGLPAELWGLHTLRRTAGTHLYRATRDLHVVADVLGHSSVSTSAIYAKMDSEVRREALEKMESERADH